MPFNIGPFELLILIVFGFGAAVIVRLGIRRLRGSRETEQLEDLKDKVELLEYELEEERHQRDRQLR